MTTTPRVVDVFAGPGGWDQGLRLLGETDVLGFEWDADACATATAAGHRRVRADVAAHPAEELVGAVGLVASPPCPDFSMAGKGAGRVHLDDLAAAAPEVAAGRPGPALDHVPDRARLVLEPIRWAAAIRPRWMAFEQVPLVLPLWEAFVPVLESLGYHATARIVNAADYGVPQTRRRAVLLAACDAPLGWPEPTHGPGGPDLFGTRAAWVTMAEALGWDDAERWRLRPGRQGYKRAGSVTRRNINGTGSRSYAPAVEPAPTIALGHDAAGWRWVAERRNDPLWPLTRPATTIAGRPLVADPGANANRYNGKHKSRNDGYRVTWEELSVLQTFPADYPWHGTVNAKATQIGNAVPPRLAAALLAPFVAS